MTSDRTKRIIALSLAAAFMLMAISPMFAKAQTTIPGHAKSGPYVDKLVFNVIEGDDAQVISLQNSEIDLIGDMVDPAFLDTLVEADNIDVANVLRNGYGYCVINTAKNPLNHTVFRRALAFALDKEAISDDVWDGLSQPQDSVVPVVNPWTIEGQLPYTYYEENAALGNSMLEAAGFYIDPDTGFRTTPQGDPIYIKVEAAQSSNIAIEVGTKISEALALLHIDTDSVPTDFYEYLNRLYFHGDFDIVFLGSSHSSFDVDWLAYDYWSEYADEPYWNFPKFQNASYDSWRDQLLHSTDYDDVYEAAIEMQRIWVYQSPEIICYENILLSAYRTDKFEGYVNDVSGGIPGYWTNYKIHLKDSLDGPFGGTFKVSNALDIDSFNYMVSNSAYAARISEMMMDSLMTIGPDGEDILWLAESYLAETHADNPDVPDGYTQFTFNMIQNATWSDGMPLTADDVAFTLNYYRDTPGNPYGADLTDLVAAYAPTTYQLIVQFNSESYWHLHTVAYKSILPKHIFTEIGIDGWNLWNPDPPTTPMVTSGPFNISDYVAGEFTELTWNPKYFYGLDRASYTDTSPVTTGFDPTMAIVAGAVGAAVVILVGGYVLMRQR